MSRKENKANQKQPLFGLGGRMVVAALAVLFMILPGLIILITALADFGKLASQSASSVSLTAAAMAAILGLILAGTGGVFLWKTFH